MAHDLKSDFISVARQTSTAGLGAVEDLFAIAQRYAMLGFAPGGRNELVQKDFKGENADLSPLQIYKVMILAQMLQPLFAAATEADYVAASEAMRAVASAHFAEGGGPIGAILMDLGIPSSGRR